MDEHREGPLMRRNPLTASEHRRQVWWQISLPILVGASVILALGMLVLQAGQGGALQLGQWAHASLIMLLIPLIALALLVSLAVAALIVVMVRLIGVIPPYARRAQVTLGRVERAARRNADAAAMPFIRLQGLCAGWRALWRRLP